MKIRSKLLPLAITLLLLIAATVLIVVIVRNGTETETSYNGRDLPSVYEYFATPAGTNIITGLVAESDGFKLNGKPIRIISGAMHYFRIHPVYWRDRLRKLRAAGANAVETYVPWNLHEPRIDEWDFGEGDNDQSLFLDIRAFIRTAQEEDLLLILRPGPFICTEFEFGGFPSYLLRDQNMQVRMAYQPYLDRVKVYMEHILAEVIDLQFTRGGPIIAFQVENEYASFYPDRSLEYLRFVRDTILANGITEMLFTSDNPWHGGTAGSLPELFKTANFGGWTNSVQHLNDLLAFQPSKPVWVMEFWTGWFDHWTEKHSKHSNIDLIDAIETTLGVYNGSLNFYMFHGGTNFAFNSGADHYSTLQPDYAADITSYDYDAPLSEAGDYTAKFYTIMEAVIKYQMPELRRPALPSNSRKAAFSTVSIERVLQFEDALAQVPVWAKFEMVDRVNMERLDMNGGSGQSQGYILYRKRTNLAAGEHRFEAGPVRNFGELIVDGELQPFPGNAIWMNSIQDYNFTFASAGEHTLDLLVENMGRVNVGSHSEFRQHKGLLGNWTTGEVYHLDGAEIQNIEIYALEFKSNWVKNLTGWKNVEEGEMLKAPLLIQSSFLLDDGNLPAPDTFLNMSRWTKGIVFINGFNLGRYWNVGPQQTLYCPGPFLRSGINTITIFEQLKPSNSIEFSAVPDLGPIGE